METPSSSSTFRKARLAHMKCFSLLPSLLFKDHIQCQNGQVFSGWKAGAQQETHGHCVLHSQTGLLSIQQTLIIQCVTSLLAEVHLALSIQQAGWSVLSHSSRHGLTARQNGMQPGLQPMQETGLK